MILRTVNRTMFDMTTLPVYMSFEHFEILSTIAELLEIDELLGI